jgi:hypothetical protein
MLKDAGVLITDMKVELESNGLTVDIDTWDIFFG